MSKIKLVPSGPITTRAQAEQFCKALVGERKKPMNPPLIVLQIVGLNTGEPTPFDGQYLKEYDCSRDGRSPDGRRLLAHIVTTPNIEDAMHLKDMAEFHAVWAAIDPRNPVRSDGKPNRPLTAFSVMAVPYRKEDTDAKVQIP
jgi:hypothetical protein